MSFDFTVDRNSPKWVLGSDGYLKEYIADAPAIEFNADGSYKGVLVEPESVNEAPQSEDLDNRTYWVGNATVTSDTEIDPKGGTNSFLLSESTSNIQQNFFTETATYAKAVASGETWTQSIFIKKGDGANAPDYIMMAYTGGGFASNYANFDISVGGGTSGTVTSSSGGTAGIRYYGNGWYRISWTATANSSDANGGRVFLFFTNNNPTATLPPTYAGQTDANVFIWGAQLEESPIATSYIPTTTAAVTRVKDDIYLTSASSLIGQTEGTLFVEVDWQGSGEQQYLLSANDGSFSNRVVIYNRDSPVELRMIASANNVQVTNQGESSTAYTGIQKIAFAYKTDDFELYRNGSSISSDTSGSLASLATLTYIDLGQSQDAIRQANMWIRAVALFTTRLSDAECEALTTI